MNKILSVFLMFNVYCTGKEIQDILLFQAVSTLWFSTATCMLAYGRYKAEQNIKILNNHVEILEASRSKTQQKLDSLKNKIAQFEYNISQLTRRTTTIEQRLESLESSLINVQHSLEDLQKKNDSSLVELKKNLASISLEFNSFRYDLEKLSLHHCGLAETITKTLNLQKNDLKLEVRDLEKAFNLKEKVFKKSLIDLEKKLIQTAPQLIKKIVKDEMGKNKAVCIAH